MEKRGYGQKILNTTIDNNSPALASGQEHKFENVMSISAGSDSNHSTHICHYTPISNGRH